jgi:hypothetical protein
MEDDIIDTFDEKAKDLFQDLLEKCGYTLSEIKVNRLNGVKWSTHHIYISQQKKLRIEIKQEPRYTDHGFSFFIYKTGTKEYNCLYNVPHGKQDKDFTFLTKACEDLFTSEETLALIMGTKWKELKRIPFSF